jgi:aminoglycoside 6'-N-acetyltransferase
MSLRRLSPDDLPAFQAYRHDPEVGRWQGWQPQPEAQALAFLNDMAAAPLFVPGTWSQLGIADALTGQLIGDVGIHISEDGREAEFGFSLARAAQGRGLASAAVREAMALVFAQTPVQRIHAQTDSRNLACIRLLERLGATKLAEIATEFRGEPCVELRYELAARTRATG